MDEQVFPNNYHELKAMIDDMFLCSMTSFCGKDILGNDIIKYCGRFVRVGEGEAPPQDAYYVSEFECVRSMFFGIYSFIERKTFDENVIPLIITWRKPPIPELHNGLYIIRTRLSMVFAKKGEINESGLNIEILRRYIKEHIQ